MCKQLAIFWDSPAIKYDHRETHNSGKVYDPEFEIIKVDPCLFLYIYIPMFWVLI